MSGIEKGDAEMKRRIHSSFGTLSSSIPKQQFPSSHELDLSQTNPNFIGSHQCPHSFTGVGDFGRRVGIPPPNQIPPVSPYSSIQVTRQPNSQNFSPRPNHLRSLSQPSSFFSFDSFPPLSPSQFREFPSTSISDHYVSMEDRDTPVLNASLPPSPFTRGNSNSYRVCESLPPTKSHRRSNSDIKSRFNALIRNSPPLIHPIGLERSVSGGEAYDWSKTANLVKSESIRRKEVVGERKLESKIMDDLFSAYMNLDKIDALNPFVSEDNKNNGNDNGDDLDSSRVSGTKTYGCHSSDTEGESSANDSGNSFPKPGVHSSAETSEGIKGSVSGDFARMSRHHKSMTMDSCYMERSHFGDVSPKICPTNSNDGNSNALSLKSRNSEFTAAEMKKIMANEKLAEIVLSDPKRVKRILANRQSAARSKERKMRYIAELEHKVQTLQTESTTLSAQLTHLQRDSIGFTNQNTELKFRLHAMEQQAQLRDALHVRLTAEVQRLKLVTSELTCHSYRSKLHLVTAAKPGSNQ